MTPGPDGSDGGRPLGDRYVLHEPIRRGATGTVWRGSAGDGSAPVAVNVLDAELADEPDARARFLRERSVLAAVEHPNVVGVRDLVVDGQTAAIVMELVEGTDLRRHLAARRTLAPAEACAVAADVAAGLAAVHAHGIVHRDVKPENVLLDAAGDGRARITDFAVARLADTGALTLPAHLVGTPEYTAPELVQGAEAAPPADVYALGALLYELLTGRPPFAGGHPPAGLRRPAEAHLDRPAGLPDDVWAVVGNCLAEDPSSRRVALSVGKTLAELSRRADGLPALPPGARSAAAADGLPALPPGARSTAAATPGPTPPGAVHPPPGADHDQAVERPDPVTARRPAAPSEPALAAVPRRRRRRLPLLGGAAVLAAVLVLAWAIGGGRGGSATRSGAQPPLALATTTSTSTSTTSTTSTSAVPPAAAEPSTTTAPAAPSSAAPVTTARPARRAGAPTTAAPVTPAPPAPSHPLPVGSGPEPGTTVPTTSPTTTSTTVVTTTTARPTVVAYGQLRGYANKCLDVRGPSAANGTAVQMWDCLGVANQRWALLSNGELRGYAGKCLDVRGPSATNGTPVQMWDCVGGSNQRWVLTAAGELRGYAGKCLDVRGPSADNGTRVQIWACLGVPNQRWRFA